MARNFNGISDQITLATVPLLPPTPLLTMAGWVNPNATQGSYAGLFAAFDAGANNFIVFIRSSLKLAFYVENTSVYDNTGTFTLSSAVWSHVAAIYSNSTGAGKAYVNGALDGSGTPSQVLTNNIPVSLGRGNTGSEFYTGGIADFGIWNVQLSVPEITALARGARPSKIRPGSLVNYLPLDGYGHPALDLSGFAHNGVLTGTTFIPGPPLFSAGPVPLVTSLPKFATGNLAGTVKFRKTLSGVGTHVGGRQVDQTSGMM